MAFMTIIDALSGSSAKNGWDKTCNDYLQFSQDILKYLSIQTLIRIIIGLDFIHPFMKHKSLTINHTLSTFACTLHVQFQGCSLRGINNPLQIFCFNPCVITNRQNKF